MRRRLLSALGIGMLLLVGSALAQSDPAQPAPTATLSPRGMVGIFQMLRVNYGLELDSPSSADTNPVTRQMLEIFAQQYLGSGLHMPYVEHVFSGTMGYDGFHYMLGSASRDLGALMSAYLMEIESLPMVTVGLREDGFALLYSHRCSNQWCSTPQEYISFLHHNGASAIYGLYVKGSIEDQDAATALIQQTFPALSMMSLSRVHEQNQGYSFSVQTSTSIYGVETPLFYYVGTMNIPRYTLVYALVGVGPDATSMMLPFISESGVGAP